MPFSFSAQIQGHSEWNVSLREKNTFLEVKYLKEEFIDAHRGSRRRHSAPEISFIPEFQINRRHSAPEVSQDHGHESSLLFCKSLDGGSRYSSEASTIEPPIMETCGAWSSESSTCTEENIKKTRVRPCKGKRARHARFLMRLMKQMESDPENFDFDGISWPPSLSEDNNTKQKVIAKLEEHKSCVEDRLLSTVKDGPRTQNTVVLSLATLFQF
jgi:hypothetical protein